MLSRGKVDLEVEDVEGRGRGRVSGARDLYLRAALASRTANQPSWLGLHQRLLPRSSTNLQPCSSILVHGALQTALPRVALIRKPSPDKNPHRTAKWYVPAAYSAHPILKANLLPQPGRQTPHPTRTRAPPGQIHRHRTPRHDILGMENQHPP